MGESVPLIVELHAEDAAILWLQRDRAVDAPHFDRMRLARLDERLEANVDGLRVAGRMGWETARAAFDKTPEPGEAFTLAALAFGAGSARGIGEVLEIVEGDETDSLIRACISGLGWLEPTALKGQVQPLLNDRRARVRALGLGACAVHRVDPGAQLHHFLDDATPVRRQALNVAGILGRADVSFDDDEDPECWFRAAWGAFRLGDRDWASDTLWDIATREGPFQVDAFEMAAAGTDVAEARSRLRAAPRLAEPLAVRLAGRIGDIDMVPWLLSKMNGDLAQIAGESFAMMTGTDLAFLGLDRATDDETGPNDDPSDPLVELDPNDDLPVPDPDKVGAFWKKRSTSFQPSQRYFLGNALSDEAYLTGFDRGFQRQRRTAALALACQDRLPLRNWRARQFRQKGSVHAPGFWQTAEELGVY